MKNITFLFSIFIAFGALSNNDKIIPSKISKVTVYSQGAQIYRTASYQAYKGLTTIIIDGISPQIDPKSLQVQITGSTVLLDAKYHVFYPLQNKNKLEGISLKTQRSINALLDSISEMNYQLYAVQDDIDLANATKSILKNNGAIKGQGKVNDSIQLLMEAMKYYEFKMSEINKKLQKLNRNKNTLERELSGMNIRLNDLKNFQSNSTTNQPKGPSHRISITISTNEFAKGKIDISYLVNSAGWTPNYDLRADVSKESINLNYKALVYQNTGVKWENVQLNISTNNPYQNKTKPTLHPWYISYNNYNRKQDLQLIDSRNDKDDRYKTNAPAAEKKFEESTIELDEYEFEQAQSSANFSQVINQLISAEFQIDLPYTIESNNEQHIVLIKNEDLSTHFKYYTVPKYDSKAYLVAQLSKLDELQLVPATANIFFDGSYIGETYIDPSSMDDTLLLSLGADPNIIVKRRLLNEAVKEKIVGNTKLKTMAYAIEIKNLKSKNIEIVVQDQIPLTTNNEIEITPLELSKGKMNSNTGIVEWSFTIKPKGKKEIKFTYEVKHEKDKQIYL